MARVHVVGEHDIAKDVRAYVRADPDLVLSSGIAARFTLILREGRAGEVPVVVTGPQISPTEEKIIAHLAMAAGVIAVNAGSGSRDEHTVIIEVPTLGPAHEALSAQLAQGLYKGLLTVAHVDASGRELAERQAAVDLLHHPPAPPRSRWMRLRRWVAGLSAAILLAYAGSASAQSSIPPLPEEPLGARTVDLEVFALQRDVLLIDRDRQICELQLSSRAGRAETRLRELLHVPAEYALDYHTATFVKPGVTR